MSETDCEQVLSDIEHYLHGELDAARAQHLAAHLAECGPCLERAEFHRRLKEIVRGKCRSRTPEHLVWRIREAIRLERTRERP